jgi:hypothetical protein
MPEWEISFEEYLERIQFSPERFKEQLRLPKINSIRKIMPLRNMVEISSIVPLRKDFLEKIIRGINTADKILKPFEFSKIKLVKADPNQLKIGQKFVYRENYQNLLEEMPRIFDKFLLSAGFCDLGALMIFGFDARQSYCLAYYIPPIIEKHEKEMVIMDGIHRNFINKQMGHTLNAILIEDVTVPFPCSLHAWDEIQIMSLKDKPKDINKRYFDLNAKLFRDLKYLGIDG